MAARAGAIAPTLGVPLDVIQRFGSAEATCPAWGLTVVHPSCCSLFKALHPCNGRISMAAHGAARMVPLGAAWRLHVATLLRIPPFR